MKQCKECGTISPDDTVYCYICGTKFLSTDEKETRDSTTIETSLEGVKDLRGDLLNDEEVESIMRYVMGCFYEQKKIDLALDTFAINRIREEIKKNSAVLKQGSTVKLNFPYLTADVTEPKHLDIDISLHMENSKSANKAIIDVADQGAEGAPLFDGVYLHIYEDYSSFLRFFSDGKVVGVSSTGTPEQVIRWLKHDYDNYGTYTVDNGIVRFELTSNSGRVSYSGRIVGRAIEIDSFSHINGHSSNNERYDFYNLSI